MICSECGRPALAYSRRKKSWGRFARPHAMKDHDLCQACFEVLANKERARQMATATKERKGAEANGALPPINIADVQAKNMGKLPEVHLRLGGQSLVVSGSNAEGKSTTLRLIQIGLGQMGSKEVPESVRKGEDSGWTEIAIAHAETGEILFKVHRDCVKNAWSPIVVRDATGEKKKRPQEFMDSFIDRVCLRPFDWLDQRPVDQVDSVLRICRVPLPVEDVERITGEEHPPVGDETAAQYLFRLSADKTGSYYVKRLLANQIWEQKKKALIDQRQKLDDLPEMEGDSGLNLDELLSKRQKLDAQRLQAQKAAKAVTDAEQELVEFDASVVALEKEKTLASVEAEMLEAEIKRLTVKLQEQRGVIADRATRIAKAADTRLEIIADIAARQKAAAKTPDPSADIANIDQQMRQYEARRGEIARRQAVQDVFEQIRQEEIDAGQAHAKAELILTELRDLRRHLLDNVDLGVKGLAIGDGELRLNDVPFKEQASSAEQGIVAYNLAKLRNPTARFMFGDNAEKFDAITRATLLKAAARDGIQLHLAVVRDDECAVCHGKDKKCEKCQGTGRVNAPLEFSIG